MLCFFSSGHKIIFLLQDDQDDSIPSSFFGLFIGMIAKLVARMQEQIINLYPLAGTSPSSTQKNKTKQNKTKTKQNKPIKTTKP